MNRSDMLFLENLSRVKELYKSQIEKLTDQLTNAIRGLKDTEEVMAQIYAKSHEKAEDK